VREINVSRAGDPVHAGVKALTRETPTKRGRVNRYDSPYDKRRKVFYHLYDSYRIQCLSQTIHVTAS
jgi:hypothetical protein